MAIYSHSKLSTFENCRHKYKLQYVDKIKLEKGTTTIEAFMGSKVHEALEMLYKALKFQKKHTLKEVLKFYNTSWNKEWTNNILIAKKKQGLTQENYKKMGEKYLTDYYKHYEPFDQLTILGIETEDKIRLKDGSLYHVRIDKFACKGDTYYVCDYKTNLRLKKQEEANSDRQLAMYSLWIKDKFKDAKKIILLWHMLAFDKEVSSERTDKELKELEKTIVALIKEIEKEKEFPRNITALCNYCAYKEMCPSFSHEEKIEQKTLREYKKDEGVILVNKFAELKDKEKKLGNELDTVKEDLIGYAKQEKIDIVYGSNKKATVNEHDKYSCSTKNKEKLEKVLNKKGLLEKFTQISYVKLYGQAEQLPKEVTKLFTKEKDYRVNLSNKKKKE